MADELPVDRGHGDRPARHLPLVTPGHTARLSPVAETLLAPVIAVDPADLADATADLMIGNSPCFLDGALSGVALRYLENVSATALAPRARTARVGLPR